MMSAEAVPQASLKCESLWFLVEGSLGSIPVDFWLFGPLVVGAFEGTAMLPKVRRK